MSPDNLSYVRNPPENPRLVQNPPGNLETGFLNAILLSVYCEWRAVPNSYTPFRSLALHPQKIQCAPAVSPHFGFKGGCYRVNPLHLLLPCEVDLLL